MSVIDESVPVAASTSPRAEGARRVDMLRLIEKFALLGLLVAIGLFFTFYSKSSAIFPTAANLSVLTANQTVVALVALAVMFPLISGYFDFSAGSIAALSSVITAALMSRGSAPLWVAVGLALLASLVIGAVNGVLVSYLRMNAFITTLAAATLIGGLIQWYTKGTTITTGISPALTTFGSARFLGVPRVVYLVLLVMLGCWYVLAQTPLGRTLYAIGSNAKAAHLVGMKVKRDVLLTFVASGGLAGLAGVLLTARTGGATADGGTSLLFPALAAVFLGATAFTPGRFNVFGTIVGVLFVSVAVSGLTLSGASAWVDPVFNGCALLVAVGLSTYLGRNSATR